MRLRSEVDRMDTRTLTVRLPSSLFDQLQQRAEQANRSLEEEAVLALAAAMPTGPDVNVDLAALLESLSGLDDGTLRRLARSRVDPAESSRLEDLADAGQRRGLIPAERTEAEALAARHDRVALIRGEAAALLKERGHDIAELVAAE